MIHNVFAGNPGSGKSTLANTLIGHQVFESGISLGAGLTTALNTQEHNGEKCSDTPGLDDINVRDQAAVEISRGLSEADQLRLIFVCTLEDGRVRPADVVTVETILEAVSKVEVDVNAGFSLIINKCNDGELKALNNDERSRNAIVRSFSCNRQLDHVYFAPKCPQAEGKPNELLPIANELRTFVRDAPVLAMPGTPVTVDLSHYQDRLNELMSEISHLRSMLNEMQRNDTENVDRQMWSQLVQSAGFAIAFAVLKKVLPQSISSLL